MKENTISNKKIFSGKLLRLKMVKVRLPNGKRADREIVQHPGAVAIVPFIAKDKIILIKQYRKAIEKELFEIPAGTLETGETPVSCAKRELIEETGYQTSKIEKLIKIYPTPGYCTEKIFIYKANKLKKASKEKDQNLNKDPDEFIETFVVSKRKIKELFRKGQLSDGKTLIALSLLHLI